MALHKIIERHKVVILGQEIIYTNEFIKYKEGTIFSIEPKNSLISHISRLFKYQYTHPILPPHLFTSPVSGEKYIIPTWQKVHPKTTLDDIEWIKPLVEDVPLEKNTWKFESSSSPDVFYIVRQKGDKFTCNCSGFFRSKIRKCKHILQIEKELNNDNK
jgi:hypothetical protein